MQPSASAIENIIRTVIPKGYDKFNIALRYDGEDIGQVPVCLMTDDAIIGKTIKFYKIYVTAAATDELERRKHIACWYALVADFIRNKRDLERLYNCRIMVDECWGFGTELCDFHRYISNHAFATKAVDDLIRSYATYNNGAFVGYLERVKAAMKDADGGKITYSLMPTSGRPSLDRAYKSFKL